jgi:hypothetical protein
MGDRHENKLPGVWAPSIRGQVLLGVTALLAPLLLGLAFAQGLWHLDEALAQRERPAPTEVVD